MSLCIRCSIKNFFFEQILLKGWFSLENQPFLFKNYYVDATKLVLRRSIAQDTSSSS